MAPLSPSLPGVCLVALLLAAPAAAQVPTATTTSSAAALVPPQLLSQPELPYPDEAKALGVSGPVRLTLTVDEAGDVSAAQVLEAPHPSLARAALAAVALFRFAPALEDGVPIAVTLDFTYRFVLPSEGETAPPEPPPVALHPEPSRPGDAPESSAFTVVVLGKRPPRSATDFTLSLGVTHAAPPAGTSGSALMRKAPGVYIAQHGGVGKGHQIFLRGFDAVHGQDVAVSAGGIPVNEVSNVHGQGYVDLHYVIPEVVKSMRVLAGPFDPRQGDFAVAGSLDMTLGLTRRGLIGRVTAGRFGLLRAMAAWGPESEPDETFVATELVRANGFGENRAWGRLSAMGQVVLPLMPGVSLRLMSSTYAGRFDAAGVVRADDYAAGRIGFYDTYDSNQGGASARHQGLVEVRYEGEGTDAAFSTWVVRRDLRLRQDFTGFLLNPEGDGVEQTSGATTFGGGGYYRRAVAERLIGEIGVQFRHDRTTRVQDRLRTVDGQAFLRDLEDDLQITDLGIYLDGELALPFDLVLRGGVRAEGLAYVIDETLAASPRREAFGYHLAPKATLQWRPMPALKLFASYGNGFRSPQAVTLGQGERSPLTVVQGGELGGRLRLGPLEATLAGFATYVEEDLIFDHTTGQNVFSGATLRTGAALVAEAQPWEFLHVLGSLTWTYAVQPESGQRVPYVPAFVGRLDVDGHEHVGEWFGIPAGLFAAAGLTVVGPRPLPFGESSAPLALLEASVGVELGPVALSLEGMNLLNLEYRDGEFVYASDFMPQGATSMLPARHFTAGQPLTVQGTLTVDY
ncbi:MAG: TonB-dependent receptor [Deltaproteobacteria bacterium]|nr:TonB-dependent receptor [Deltaproteobacteria bacterium]